MAGQPTDAEIIAAIPDTLPIGLWVARAPGGEFVYANTTFKEIMGMAGRDDVAAGEYAEPYGIHGLDGAHYPEEKMPFVRAVQARTTVMVDDIVIHRTDGRKVHVRAYAEPVFDDQTITHVVIAFFDISREVQAERARKASENQLQRTQRMESVGNLAGGIAHDFNNLLGAIRMIATSLMEQAGDADTASALQAIDSATQSAQELTQALVGFAGGQAGEHQPLQVDDIVRRVSTLLGRALDPRHELVLELDAPPPVMGDPTRLEQVVMNLAINARDAMPEGGRITIRSRERAGITVLSVLDEGPGIPEELVDRVFEPYFTTRSGQGRGVGLGLATVYGIVGAHGGSVAVRPSARGAHLEICLPAVSRSLDTIAPRADTPVPAERLPGLRVLVVDDEELVADAAALALRTLGHTPVVVHSGAEALDRFRDDRGFAAVLLDLAMPGMDGRATAAALRTLDADVRIVLASGYALEAQQQSLRDIGVRAFLDKPYGMAQLQTALRRALK